MRHCLHLRVGPVSYRIGSAWRAPIDALRDLYSDYPRQAEIPDYTVRLEPAGWGRRRLRPSIRLAGDHLLPEALPLPLDQGLLAAEMGMNVQLALGERRFLLLHAATMEREGRALLLTGESGAGKSTLSALLAHRGWRFMGDEFALIEPATGLLHPFPRAISLKNESIAALGHVSGGRWGPLLRGTPKGDVRHLAPPAEAVERMDEPAPLALILFPRFGLPDAVRHVPPSEAFVRLTQASTNYVALGERGFDTLTRLVERAPALAIDYPDGDAGVSAIEALWAAL